MTDKEMLELAAKAAHIEHGADRLECGLSLTENGRHRSLPKWNPLTDDGDALRLAVKLGIDLTFHGATFIHPYVHSEINPSYAVYGENWFEECAEEDKGYEIHAATRRAIVRAAAEIGRSMP